MRLPFTDRKEFERLPGERPACAAVFRAHEIDKLLETKEAKVLATAARFLQVPEAEIIQIIPFSNYTVNIIFAEKQYDLYDWDDSDD